MSSKRKRLAARANGALGKGRKTQEGLARCALNAVTHGLTARNLVLSNESEEEYRNLRDACMADLKPQGTVEYCLVEQFVAARWRLERVLSMENALLDLEMKKQADDLERDYENIDPDTRLALAFRGLADQSNALALLNRYEARHRRDADRALATLLALRVRQNEILRNEANPKIEHSARGAGFSPRGASAPPNPPQPSRITSLPSRDQRERSTSVTDPPCDASETAQSAPDVVHAAVETEVPGRVDVSFLDTPELEGARPRPAAASLELFTSEYEKNSSFDAPPGL
jgi:hypothetical protein